MASLNVIARIHSGFPEKFGIPRQSGIVKGLKATIVFEEQYRTPEALRGLETFSHIWLLWGFSQAQQEKWSPTVRPPRLGGNTRMGVFATRSPYRPNSIGLSSVQLEKIELDTPHGPVLHILGADLLDGTPVYDIKPYLPFTDSHPEAVGGFAAPFAQETPLRVQMDDALLTGLPQGSGAVLRELLAQDPRPSYQRDSDRIYGMAYSGFEVKFTVSGDVLTVTEITKRA